MEMKKLNKVRQERVNDYSAELREVDPADILPHLQNFLTRQAVEGITCEQTERGQSRAATKLFHKVVCYDKWFEHLIPALRTEGYNAKADLLDDPQEIRHNNHTTETDQLPKAKLDVCRQMESLFNNIPPLAADNTVDKTIPSDSQPQQLKTAASSSKEANPRDSTSQSKASEPCAKASVKKLEKDLPGNSEAHEPQAPSQMKGVESSGNFRMSDGEKQAFVDGGTPSADEAGWNVDETKHVSSKLDGSHNAKGKANKSTGDTVNQTASRDANPENGKSAGGSRAVQRGSNMAVNSLNVTNSCCLVSKDYMYSADGVIGLLHSKDKTFSLEISSKSCSTLPEKNGSTSLAPNPQIQNGNVLLQRSSQGDPVQQPTETSSHTCMPDAIGVPSVDGTFTEDALLDAGVYSSMYHGSTSNQLPKAVQEIQASPSVNTQLDAAQVTIQQLSPSAQSELDQPDHPSHIENQIKGMDHLPAVNNKQQGDIAALGATRGGLVNNGVPGDVGTVVDPVKPVGACEGTGISAGVDVDVDVEVGATGGEGFGIGTASDEVGTGTASDEVGTDTDEAGEAYKGSGSFTAAPVGAGGGKVVDDRVGVEIVTVSSGAGPSEGADSGSVGDTPNDSCASVGTVGIVGASLFDDVRKGDEAGGASSKGLGLAGTIGNVGASEGGSSIDNVAEGDEAGGAVEGARAFDDVPDGDRAAGPDVGAAPAPQGRGALIGTVALAVPVLMSLAALAIKGGALDI